LEEVKHELEEEKEELQQMDTGNLDEIRSNLSTIYYMLLGYGKAICPLFG
jgi:hypothetical protein